MSNVDEASANGPTRAESISDGGEEVADLGGVAHEVGTLRMTATGEGVVDTDLAFRGCSNLYACEFPVSPGVNPSLTTVALTLRLARHLRGQ
jgi:choline dehydrogenase-like flavoprotein